MLSTDEPTTRKDAQTVQERREQIYGMYLRGSSETEIAEVMGVNQSTVSRALEAVRKENREWFSLHWDQGGYLGGLLKEQKDRVMGLVREAWLLFESTNELDVSKKIQALNLVKSTLVYLGQMLGLQLPSLPEHEYFDLLNRPEETVNEATGTDPKQENASS